MVPLVLLPGMMCDGRLFASQMAAFSGERAVQVAPLTGAATVAELAAQVLADAPPRFALAGLSMGGIVAMEVVRQAPDRVAGLALLDTNPLAELAEVAAGREPQIAKAQAGQLRTVMRNELKPRYLAEGPRKAAILDLCMEMAEGLGAEVFVRQSRALQGRPDQSATLRGVSVPTLVLCGAEDSLCPVSRHELMRDLVPGAELVVIEGAGHLPVLEQPKAANSALAAWLDRL